MRWSLDVSACQSMSSVAYVFIILFILYAGVTCEKSRLRIINGEVADSAADNLSFQAVLEYKNGHIFCGGIILDERHILTAAHCVHRYKADALTVVVGSNDLRSEAGVRHLVASVRVHEDYDTAGRQGVPNDIALIRLALPIVFDNRYVAPALLPQSGDELHVGDTAIISGFGKTSLKTSQGSAELYKTPVFIMSNAQCQQYYPARTIRPTNICTRHPDKVTGFCRGDSGGPLSINGTVIGLVSFSSGYGCANPLMMPQVFTRVSEYIDWINYWRNS